MEAGCRTITPLLHPAARFLMNANPRLLATTIIATTDFCLGGAALAKTTSDTIRAAHRRGR